MVRLLHVKSKPERRTADAQGSGHSLKGPGRRAFGVPGSVGQHDVVAATWLWRLLDQPERSQCSPR